MPELQQLRADHAPAVLAFELANRGYFADFISDRGDDYFHRFDELFGARLAEQEAGVCAFYLLVDAAGNENGDGNGDRNKNGNGDGNGSVSGRFNLYDIGDGTARLGYRVGQHVAGRGVATAMVRELCRVAVARYGLRTLRAATSHDNVASQRVLVKAGFVPEGPAGPAHLGGKSGTWYRCDLAAAGAASQRAPGSG